MPAKLIKPVNALHTRLAQRCRCQAFERQPFQGGGEASIRLINANVNRQHIGVDICASARRMRPDLARVDPHVVESIDADRKVSIPRAIRSLREAAAVVDKCWKDVQSGIQQRRMKPCLRIVRKTVRQLDLGEDLSEASLDALYALERLTVFQTDISCRAIKAVARN